MSVFLSTDCTVTKPNFHLTLLPFTQPIILAGSQFTNVDWLCNSSIHLHIYTLRKGKELLRKRASTEIRGSLRGPRGPKKAEKGDFYYGHQLNITKSRIICLNLDSPRTWTCVGLHILSARFNSLLLAGFNLLLKQNQTWRWNSR